MIIITGAAGFIGSCVVRTLNDDGRCDVLAVDNIASTEKWKNLSNKKYLSYVHKSNLLSLLGIKGYPLTCDAFCSVDSEKIAAWNLDEGEINLSNIEAIIHLGACSSTTETDFDYLYNNNFEFTKALWNYCADHQIPFIYASSAATYGDGTEGFDDECDIDNLMPLNAYGYSKHLFDLWVKHQAERFPPQHVGLKFFNVYGANEYYKGSMASMVFHGFNQIKIDGEIRLFESCNPNYKNGEQLRDFVYVKDVCDVIMWFLCHSDVSGLFNVGTGRAQSFRELAEATFHALNISPNIRYIDMPERLREKYQYYTQAEMQKLRSVGYDKSFRCVQEGVKDYVQEYLNKGYKTF